MIKPRAIKPETTLVIHVDNPRECFEVNQLEFDDLRLQIAQNRAEGWICIHQGEEFPISPNGSMANWPPELFSLQSKILGDLLRARVALSKERREEKL